MKYKSFIKKLFRLFLTGLVFLFVINILELLNYNLRNAYPISISTLLPVFLLTFALYLVFFFIFILPTVYIINIIDKYISKNFMENRTYQIWTFIVLISIFISIHASYLNTGKLFYFAATGIFILFFVFFDKKSLPHVTVMLFAFMIGLYFYHIYDLNSAVSKLSLTKTENKNKPNVLLIVADTTRQDHLGFYNYRRNTTPNLDRIAKKALVYENAFSTSSWTRPSMASLITSKFLSGNATQTTNLPLDYDGIQMAQFFRAKNYSTVSISSNDNLSAYSDLSRGYDHTVYSLPPHAIHLFRFFSMKLFYMTINKETGNVFARKYYDVLISRLLKDLSLNIKELPDFLSGKIDAKKNIPAGEKQIYINVLSQYSRYVSGFKNIEKKFDFMQNSIFAPFLNYAYINILYLYFFPPLTSGEMLNHWMMDNEVSDQFINWMEKRQNGEQPFFAHLQYMGAHVPYIFQEPNVLPVFDRDYKNPAFHYHVSLSPQSEAVNKAPEDIHNNLVANYDNSILSMDANIQRIIDYLDKNGYLENTIVVFLGDHGEAFYEHKNYHHRASLHYELVNVPLLFFWQNKLIPGRISRPASLVDIFPSLLTLAGYDEDLSKMNFDGESLFDSKLFPKKDIRENFKLKLSVEILEPDPANKAGEPSGTFGVHSGIMTLKGKVIKEHDKNGIRYLYFPFGDHLEDRSRAIIDPKSPDLPQYIRDMIEELPPPTKSVIKERANLHALIM